ncbi:Sec-independent protein translocase subunit TatA [Actinospica sp.]|jgi:sec-independent protein translocase protein TatA|uniref:Sec-independent protein translocase subunit TatA n=1 Tax=Actinospica sp. TaxID=1872142 RepID=UPI002D168744|nr:Sec-independent protein translocase subunit TatA [Actinospica sp.]HWG27858.1 Sec-independent protein translocase subunit TatA [Actinospica sp.]
MFRGGLEPWHVIVILGLIVLLFGSRKLPDAARSVGQSLRIFKSEMKAAAKDDVPASPAPQAGPVAPPQAVEGSVVNQTAQPANDAVPAQDAVQR